MVSEDKEKREECAKSGSTQDASASKPVTLKFRVAIMLQVQLSKFGGKKEKTSKFRKFFKPYFMWE